MAQKRKQPTSQFDFNMYGYVPPQAMELEEVVLGAIMLEKDAFDRCAEVIKTTECFYKDVHQKIFKAMAELRHRSAPLDIMSVVEQLRKNEELEAVGGIYYVTKLTNSVVSSASIEHHSKIIFEKYILRKIIEAGSHMVRDAYQDSTDAFQLMDKIEGEIFAILNSTYNKSFFDMEGLLFSFMQKLEEKRLSKNELIGVTSGFSQLDKFTNGWQETDLIILAARPSVGKTAFALNLARNAALSRIKPTPVGFFSLEMSASQLIQRMVSAESEISLDAILKGRIDDNQSKQIYSEAVQRLAKAPIFIDDTPALNIFEMRAKARRMKADHGVGLIIVDYLQLMSGMNTNYSREQEISNISRSLKALAKELRIPVIALSQLSRELEKRSGANGKVPQLSDLRESGAIEQDADEVLFLYRPEYHDIRKNEMGDPTTGETHVKIAKNRNGSLETIILQAKLWIQKFTQDIGFTFGNPAQRDYKSAAAGEQVEEKVPDDLPF